MILNVHPSPANTNTITPARLLRITPGRSLCATPTWAAPRVTW